ncbi:MAG: endolytic transglycosylase MltG [Gemmatimonadaceae bacterium]
MRSDLRRNTRRTVLLALGATSALAAGCGGGAPVTASARVTIPSGATFRAATDSLARVGLVAWPRLFRVYAKFKGRDREVKAGTYAFRRSLSWGDLLRALARGEGAERPVTIPEGFAIRDMEPVLARVVGIDGDSMDVAVRDTALLHHFDVPSGTLEGYLFPDTYQLAVGTSARAAVAEMTRRFDAVWKPDWNGRLRELGMSRHDIVTLASIIEKEARLAEERAVISAVYHNRLRAQMPLQADPTIQYALGAHHDRVLFKDLEIDSPYNTYRHPGLPPGPIASPGRASLEAALYPASVPYKFFVASPDGHHEFRETFRAHTQAIRDVRRAKRERGGT